MTGTIAKFDARRLRSLEDSSVILTAAEEGVQLIAEQVESFPLGESAKLLGLSWQQGFYHGKPAVMERTLELRKGRILDAKILRVICR
ncbi:hypothetical protein QAA78_000085 [Enterobacter hormaechei]|nr:hypothetical protein [Enterobacter hormaechei]MEC6096354.1 hypothetical protein [Enterobacter hormaechei]